MSKRMYERGGCIPTIKDLALEVYKEKYVYFNHKPLHYKWVGEMRFAFIIEAIACGQFSYATLTEYGHSVLMKRAEAATGEECPFEAVYSPKEEDGQSTL